MNPYWGRGSKGLGLRPRPRLGLELIVRLALGLRLGQGLRLVWGLGPWLGWGLELRLEQRLGSTCTLT